MYLEKPHIAGVGMPEPRHVKICEGNYTYTGTQYSHLMFSFDGELLRLNERENPFFVANAFLDEADGEKTHIVLKIFSEEDLCGKRLSQKRFADILERILKTLRVRVYIIENADHTVVNGTAYHGGMLSRYPSNLLRRMIAELDTTIDKIITTPPPLPPTPSPDQPSPESDDPNPYRSPQAPPD